MTKAIRPLILVTVLSAAPAVSAASNPVYLSQNWTDENDLRAQSYHLSQGSQLIPYEWFLHLQAPQSDQLLRSDQVIEALRYLPDYNPDPILNPDRLPVGFVKDSDPANGNWIGLNCAACHTGQFKFRGHTVRIDGGPAMGDYVGLLTTVRDAIVHTLSDQHRFDAFAEQLSPADSTADHLELRQQMAAAVEELNSTIRNAWSPEHTPGFGRVDAFASIRNEVFVTDLGIEANFQLPSAPVSYPFLWNTPELDRVQWAGNVENPYGRNAGQVLGVMGRLNLQEPAKLFDSSIRRDNLYLFEEWIAELKSPRWPTEILGEIDTAAAERGKMLYTTADVTGYSCADCHTLPGDDGQYPLTPASENRFGKRFIQTFNIPLTAVGTDPGTLLNIYDPKLLDTGLLAGVPGVAPQMIGAQLLSLVTQGTVANLFAQPPALTPEQQLAYIRFRVAAADSTPLPRAIGYKARPLNGVWATAPFLHNGSVPDLYTLLLPDSERVESFWVGNFTFDNKKVGYVNRYSPGAFLYDTSLAGNRNTGHVYGTSLGESERWDLIEFLKTL